MLGVPASVKIYLATEPTDMRKGFYGLSKLVRDNDLDEFAGHLFVFMSRNNTRVKILFWDRGGFVLWYKYLEQGKFRMPPVDEGTKTVNLDAGQLAMLLDGVDLTTATRERVWHPPSHG